jgi:hypothetical protein
MKKVSWSYDVYSMQGLNKSESFSLCLDMLLLLPLIILLVLELLSAEQQLGI